MSNHSSAGAAEQAKPQAGTEQPTESPASRYQRMTSTELQAAIDAGTEPQPKAAVLCSDGWLTFRHSSSAN